jgi:hypothetical protein
MSSLKRLIWSINTRSGFTSTLGLQPSFYRNIWRSLAEEPERCHVIVIQPLPLNETIRLLFPLASCGPAWQSFAILHTWYHCSHLFKRTRPSAEKHHYRVAKMTLIPAIRIHTIQHSSHWIRHAWLDWGFGRETVRTSRTVDRYCLMLIWTSNLLCKNGSETDWRRSILWFGELLFFMPCPFLWTFPVEHPLK